MHVFLCGGKCCSCNGILSVLSEFMSANMNSDKFLQMKNLQDILARGKSIGSISYNQYNACVL